jgi:hypothetical protein
MVKSGYDGETRKTPIFRRSTQDYMRRLAWRYLRTLAFHSPEQYAPMAAEVLVHYRVHGGLSFRLYGNATLVSESGQRSQISGETLNITQLAYVLQSTLNAELTINFRYSIRPSGRGSAAAFAPNNIIQSFQHEVNLQTSLEPNEFVVVGENAIRNSAQLTDGIDGTVFYIVQWPVAE